MTQHEEELMHRAKVITLMTEKDILYFTSTNKISMEDLNNFFLKYCRLPRLTECEFLNKYGFDKFSLLSDASAKMPTINEIMNVFKDPKFGTEFKDKS